MNRLNKVDQLTTATTQRHNRILPLMELEKTAVTKDFTVLRNESQACKRIENIISDVISNR